MKGPNRHTDPVTELKIGYATVSTVDQDLTAQHDALTTRASTPNAYVDHGLTGTIPTDPACAKPSRPAAAATPWSSQATPPPARPDRPEQPRTRTVRSEQGVGRAQRPVAGRAELGELGVDVDLDRAEEVDVVRMGRGDVGQHLVVDVPARGAHRLHREAVVLGRPGHDGVGDQRQSPRLFGLGLQLPGPHGALVGVEQVAFESVRGLALVE